MNNDNYLFLFADGNADNALVFSEEELAKKKVIFMMSPLSYQNVTTSLSIIEEINAFIENNSSVNHMLIIPTQEDNFNFDDELNTEEFFYKNYDQIEHPEKIRLQVPTAFVANQDNTLRVVYDEFSLTRCKEIDQKIELFSRDIKDSKLSPFEKVLATYLLCTRFMDANTEFEKEGNPLYIPDEENVFSSSMHVLSDDQDGYKIKCAGYTDMFARMLKKMDVEVTPMNIFNFEKGFAHTVAMVDVFDLQYGISGKYICDLRADSDMRKMVDNATRNNADKSDFLYYGCDSLLYFGLSVDDYESLVGIDNYAASTKYRTELGQNEARDEVALDSLEVSKIKTAFGKVNGFRYAIGENLDEYLAMPNAIRSIEESMAKTIASVENSRGLIKNARDKSTIDTVDELSQMMVSENETDTSKSGDSNSNNRK